jgi:hypothetical protein
LLSFHFVTTVHPDFHLDVLEPIGDRGYATPTIFFDMLFPDVPHGHNPAVAVGYGPTEDSLALKYSLAVVSQGSVSRIGKYFLCCVKPVVDVGVVFHLATPDFYARHCMMVRVHYLSSSFSAVSV